MNKARLLKLAKFLREKVPARHFNLDTIYSNNNNLRLNLKKLQCNTTACACGWVPTCFPRSSFVLYEDCVVPKDDLDDTSAINKFLGLNHDEWEYLFMSYNYPPNKRYKNYVANRIEKFVKNGGKLPKKYL